MQLNWTTVFIVQFIIWLIVLFEWKQFKKTLKADRITFSVILILSAFMSFFNLENLPGPITLLQYIFGPLGRLME
ncbi:hypothetical protein [Calidifontibacillus oryziterrae]|uniref:hypothetical protein n=1 Tax=Calidifontibacillus oryziterrae TaxID=1191699 RepID=UPI0002F1CC4C|nr:hypothetical protein [Calidifontibacillus oryziterrae]